MNYETRLSVEQQSTLSAQLIELLRKLPKYPKRCLEYGMSQQPGGLMTFLRIRYSATAGGMQYGIREVYMHGEGSGVYFPDVESAATYAMERICYFHRTTRFTRAEEPSHTLELFWNNSEYALSAADRIGGARDVPSFIRNSVTFTL